jgi:hypothetical protein
MIDINPTQISIRNQILGIRTTTGFVSRFDELCLKLDSNRSEVARYCLNRFLEANKNPDTFAKIKKELF